MKTILIIFLSFFVNQLSFSQTHITLIYTGTTHNVTEAVKVANEILNNKDFYGQIGKIQKFDNSILRGKDIADRIEKASQQIIVVRKNKPKAIASTSTSDQINISRKLFGIDSTKNFDLATAVNTLIHETVHAVDYLGTGNEFTHNGNSSKGQENTAPWMIGAIAEEILQQDRFKH